MGHYASEMDPGWADSIDRSDRENKARRQIGELSLSSFKASDIPMLLRMYPPNQFARGLYDEDFKRVAELLRKGNG